MSSPDRASPAPGVQPGRPLAEASTIPASWYFDPAHHRRELDRVIARTWQHVARADQLKGPGDYVTADIGDERVLVVRGADGALRAFSNVCRHRAGVVAQGEGCGAKAFRCTYHGWTYGLRGELLVAPEMEGVAHFSPQMFALPGLRCETWGPFVFVNLDPRAPSLSDTIGSLPARAAGLALEAMTFGGRETYTIACNWKVYVDNYLEGYHIPRAHLALNRVLDYGRYAVETDGNLVIQSAPARVMENAAAPGSTAAPGPPARDVRAVLPGGSKADLDRAGASRIGPASSAGPGSLYVWLYPNFMLNVSRDYAQTNMILPIGPERTLCIFDYYFPSDVMNDSPIHATVGVASQDPSGSETPAHERSKTWADSIQQEDIWLCESVQQNLRSRFYSTGRYSVKRENGLYHFHELLRRALA